MAQLFPILIIAALVFAVCYAVDKTFAKLFRSKAQHRSALSPCVPPRPPSGSSKTPASLSSGPLQQLPPCPGTSLFSMGEPCLSPRPGVRWALHRGAVPDHLG